MSKKSQAEHNEKASRYLHKSGQFPDWVITTAFYSAIHFADACLFPGNYVMYNDQTHNCQSIDEYYRMSNQGENKHQIRLLLVEDTLPEIKESFKWLKEHSSHLRYYNYQASEEEGNKAIKYLDEIKSFCQDHSK